MNYYRVMILGGDGYLGWPTAMYLADKRYRVHLIDNFSKRTLEKNCRVKPLWETPRIPSRISLWNDANPEKKISWSHCDITQHKALYREFDEFTPTAVVHYAEQPSAPYSMSTGRSAIYTQYNNVIGTLGLIMAVAHYNKDCHIIKLGTLGEYGTPNIDIEEGYLDIEHKGRKEKILYPKKPISWYHMSKVHDSHNLEMACRIWGLRATDLNQGVVYGIDTDQILKYPKLGTSFHYDSIFGTVINRFITQVVCGEPMTVYGGGRQIRGFINIRDTLKCIELALLNPAPKGQFRVINQLTETHSIKTLARTIQDFYGGDIKCIENPRDEIEGHYYNVTHTKLTEMGLKPHLLGPHTIHTMAQEIAKHKDNIDPSLFNPTIKWRGGQQ